MCRAGKKDARITGSAAFALCCPHRHANLRGGTMRLASYNVENLFERPAIMNLPSWDDGRDILNRYAKLAKLLESEAYTASIKI